MLPEESFLQSFLSKDSKSKMPKGQPKAKVSQSKQKNYTTFIKIFLEFQIFSLRSVQKQI